MEREERKKKFIWFIVLILILFFGIVGSTLAYFALNISNNIINGKAGEVNLSLSVTKILPNTTGTDDIIITGFNNLADCLNNSCMYGSGTYATCQLYKITLTNNSSTVNTNVSGSVSFDNENTPNLSWILVDNYSSDTTYTASDLGSTYNTSSSSFVKFTEEYLLSTGSTVNYYMLVWVNDSAGTQTDNGEFSGTIRFEDENGKGVTSSFSE